MHNNAHAHTHARHHTLLSVVTLLTVVGLVVGLPALMQAPEASAYAGQAATRPEQASPCDGEAAQTRALSLRDESGTQPQEGVSLVQSGQVVASTALAQGASANNKVAKQEPQTVIASLYQPADNDAAFVPTYDEASGPVVMQAASGDAKQGAARVNVAGAVASAPAMSRANAGVDVVGALSKVTGGMFTSLVNNVKPLPEVKTVPQSENAGSDVDLTSADEEEPTVNAASDDDTPTEPSVIEGPASFEKAVTLADGSTYVVRLAYEDGASIPVDTELVVREVRAIPEDATGNSYAPTSTEVFVSKEELSEEVATLSKVLKVTHGEDRYYYAQLLDVELMSGDEVVKPQASGTLTLRTDAVELKDSDLLEVAHLGDEDARPLEVTNLSGEGEGVRLSVEVDRLGELGVMGVARSKLMWESHDEVINIQGPGSLDISLSRLQAEGLEEGFEALAAFGVQVSSLPAYGTRLWIEVTPQDDFDSAHGPDEGIVGYRLEGGSVAGELFGTEGTEPFELEPGEEIALAWDTGLREQTIEIEGVTISGLMPKGARAGVRDVADQYADLGQELLDSEGETTVAAAYDLVLVDAAGDPWRLGEEDPVSVSLPVGEVGPEDELSVWRLGASGPARVENFDQANGRVTFEAADLGTYAVLRTVPAPEEDEGEEDDKPEEEADVDKDADASSNDKTDGKDGQASAIDQNGNKNDEEKDPNVESKDEESDKPAQEQAEGKEEAEKDAQAKDDDASKQGADAEKGAEDKDAEKVGSEKEAKDKTGKPSKDETTDEDSSSNKQDAVSSDTSDEDGADEDNAKIYKQEDDIVDAADVLVERIADFAQTEVVAALDLSGNEASLADVNTEAAASLSEGLDQLREVGARMAAKGEDATPASDGTLPGGPEGSVVEGSTVEGVAQVALQIVENAIDTILSKDLVATDGRTYVVTVTCGHGAGVPANAELEVNEILPEDKGYDTYVAQAAQAIGTTPDNLELAKPFSIRLIDPDTGGEVQPTGDVWVSMRLVGKQLDGDSPVDVVHLGNTVDVMESSAKGDVVSFETDGFSVYVVAGAKAPYDAAVDGTSVADLDELNSSATGFYLSYGSNNYFTNEVQNYNNKGNTYKETTSIAAASKWFFEAQGNEDTYYISTYVDGIKNYMYNISGNNMSLISAVGSATPFTLSKATDGKFYFKKADENKWLQHSSGGNGIRLYAENSNATNSQIIITYTEAPNDYYELDGKSYCIAYDNENSTDIGLTNTASAQLVQIDNDSDRLIAETGTVARWNFENTDGTNYKISTKINGAQKYLALNESGPYLSDESCVFTLNSYSGKFSFKANEYYLCANENTFGASTTEGDNAWFILADLEEPTNPVFWENLAYTIQRDDTVTLDEIFTACNITAITSDYVDSIVASDPEILQVTGTNVTNLKAFAEPQTLTLTLIDGTSGTIMILAPLEESANLNEFLDNATFIYDNEATEHPLSEPAVLDQGDSLQLNLSFSEIAEGQDGERQMALLSPMVYTLPEGLSIVDTEISGITISIQSGSDTRSFPATVEIEADARTLTITGNYESQEEAFVKSSTVASFSVPVTVQVSTVPHDYALGNGLTLSTGKPRNVKASSFTANYNEANDIITYTAVVEAESNIDSDTKDYPVTIADLTAGDSPALQFVSGSYTYAHAHGEGFVLPEGAPETRIDGVEAVSGTATDFNQLPLTVEHMYDGDTITLTYTAKGSTGAYDKATGMAQVKNTLTLTNNDGNGDSNPFNNTEDDTAEAITSFAYSPLAREFVRLEGSWAYWQVTVNPKGYTINDGAAMTLADTFDDDYPDREHKTDAGQSIDYHSIAIDSGKPVTYDYSGNTGTYVIPDDTPVTITYRTRIAAQPGDNATFRGTAVLEDSNGNTIGTSNAKQTAVIYPSASDVAGSGTNHMIKLFVYAEGQMQTGVNGVQFILLDANQRAMEFEPGQPVTFTTETNADGMGFVDISLDGSRGITIEKNTAYYLEMIKVPSGYQKDNQLYSFMITDDPNYNSGGIYTYYNGDTMKVRLYPASPGLRVSIRFSGSYALREDQQNGVEAVLQHEVGGTWEELERHSVSDAQWGAITFTTQLSQVENYRVIQENEKPWDLPEQIHVETKYYCMLNDGSSDPFEEPIPFSVGNEDDSVNVVIDNRYEEPQLTLVKMNKKTGELLPGAVFSVYKIVEGSSSGSPVKTYTTDENGELVIRGGEPYESETLYGIRETTPPNGYLLPQTGNEEWHYFYFCNDTVLEPSILVNLPKGKTATNLTTSGDTITIDNQKKTVTIPVMALWQGNAWPENTEVTVGLYQSVDGAPRTKVTDGSGNALTVNLNSAAPYNNNAFTGLPSRDAQNRNITYSIIEERINELTPLEARYVQEYGVSDAGVYVVRNRKATSLAITKKWFNPDGTQITDATELAKQPAVTFDVYRTTDFVLPDAGGDAITSGNMSAHVSNAEKVRENLTIDHSRNWNEANHDWEYTIDDLELMSDDRTPYLYYALETVPSFGDETYKIEYNVLESDGNGHDVVNNKNVTIQNTIKTETAPLTVTKAALVNDPRTESLNREFDFTLELKKGDNQPIRQWTVYRDENDSTKDLVSDWDGKVSFKLKALQSIMFTLPVDVTATVTEAAHSEYTVQTSTDGGTTKESGRTYSYEVTSGSNATLTYINTLRAVCKVVPDGNGVEPVVCESLKSALQYLRSHPYSFTSPWTIYMLEDYEIPETDVLDVRAGEEVILTTASTKDSLFPFKDNQCETDRAIITRGGVGNSILKNAGTLTLKNIVLDGNKENYSIESDGGLVYNTGDLNLNEKTILCNSETEGKGGAVYSTGTVNMETGVEITDNSAKSASAICLANGTLNISGGVIENNTGAEDGAVVAETAGVRIYPTGSPILFGNTNADGNAANIYLDANSDSIITVKGSGLSEGAQIGVTAFPGHMEIGEQFATADFNLSEEAKALLRCFVNDTNGYLGKLGEGSQTSIVWDGLTMEIKKVFDGVGANPSDSFDITLTSSVIRKNSYVISGNYDYSVVPGRQSVSGKIILRGVKADDSISISPLPAGTYIIAEAASNYRPEFTGVIADPAAQVENGIQFSLAENGTVTVKNKRRLAVVELKKTLKDRLAGENSVGFDFTVTLTETDGAPIKDFTLAEGITTNDNGETDPFTMSPKNGGTGAVKSQFQVPVGAAMTIKETVNSNYRITASAETMPKEGKTEETIADGDSEHDNVFVVSPVTDDGAAVTFENERKMAHIDLTKELVGKVSAEETFTFGVTLIRADGSPAAGYIISEDTANPITTDNEGKASIPITFTKSQAASADLAQTVHAKSVRLVIPEGTKLTVEETDANGHSNYYKTTVSRNGGSSAEASTLTINGVSDDDSSIVFRNERKLQTVNVTNTVSGYAGNVTPFQYIVTVTDWAGEGDKPEDYDDYDDHGFTNGVLTFELAGGQNRELKVPYGAKLKVEQVYIVGYETTVKHGNNAAVLKRSDEFNVTGDVNPLAFTNTQLIKLVLVNTTSSILENVQVYNEYSSVMYRVNAEGDGQDSVTVNNKWASVSVESNTTAILLVRHPNSVTDSKNYTVKGTMPADGYYYTINNEPSFHEYANPAVLRVYDKASYEVKGKLRYSVQDSTVTFTEQPLVSFDVNGGAWTTAMEGYHDRDGDRQVYQQAVDKGSKVQAPSPAPVYPTAEEIAFLGWTADEAFAKNEGHTAGEDISAKAYNFETPVSAPVQLYAVWSKPARDTHIVTVKNGHTESLNVAATLTSTDPAGVNYTLYEDTDEPTNSIITDADGRASLTLGAGESKNLTVPDSAKLVLGLDDKASLAVSSEYALTASSDNKSYSIESVNRDGTVTFIPGVCKITDSNGNVLYDGMGKPAVYGMLSDAFTAYDGTLYTDASHTTAATPAEVKMLVDEYEISSKHIFPTKKMTLTTAGKGDTDFPFLGIRDRTTLYRESFATDSLFTHTQASEITLTNIILDGRNVPVGAVNGGLINVNKSGAKLTIDTGTTMQNVVFAAYASNGNGGAVYIENGTLAVNGGLFSALQARQGGAICAKSSAQLSIQGTGILFENCSANASDGDGDGGAIYYAVNKQLIIDGASDKDNPGIEFDSCVAKGSKGSGGAMYVASSNYQPRISGCSFTECSARDETNTNAAYGGGAICANNVNGLTVSYCSFTACDTMSRGGGVVVYVKEGQTVTVTGCSFEKCNCKGQGGAVAVYQPNQEKERTDTRAKTKLSVNGCDFSNCSSGTNNGSGGAIQCYVPCMELTDSNFTDCWAGKEGGAVNNYFGAGYTVMWNGSYLTLTNCHFTRCRAEDRYEVTSVIHYGGAVNTKVKTVNVSSSTFTDCVSTLRDGGALHLGGCGTGTTATIMGSTFTGCTAKRHGGAVFSSAETLTISDNTMFSNCASTADLGGAVYHGMNCREESNVKANTLITSCEFENCSAAVNGGAIWSAAKAATITDCTITGCTAESGGAIYLSKKDIKNTINSNRVETQLTMIDVNKPNDALARGTITGGSITGSRAVNGSAVYVGDSAIFSDITVGGQETETSKPGNICTNADSGAIHGGTLYFEGNTVVEGNKYSEDLTARDVLMQVDGVATINTTENGLGVDANIGVYVPDTDQDGRDGQFTRHGLENTPFGTWGKENDLLGSFFNDRDDNLFGYQLSASDKKIYWGPYVCKITDAEGNTLKRANGGDAVYTRLSTALQEFTSVKDANEQTNAVYIKMLVEDYAIRQEEAISNFPAANITLTTETHTDKEAVAGEYDGKHPYRGTAGTVSTINRNNSTNPLFDLGNSVATFQLKDITLDGRKSKTATEGEFNLITANSGEIVVNSGTTLQYAKGDSGAAITGVTVTINGSYDETKKAPTVKITNCKATGNGGAISAQNLSISNTSTDSDKYGATFTNCTATLSGGAIYATGTTVTMNGASFADCHSTGEGGVLFHNSTGSESAATDITDCAFTNSGTTGGAGGAVSSKAATLTVGGTSFDSCTAAGNGGAINHTGAGSATITGSTFNACSTTGSENTGFGGSVYTEAAALTLNGGGFQNSTAANHGGAVYLQNSANEGNITGTEFNGCSTTITDGCGGAVYSNGTTLTLQDYTPEGSSTKTGTVINNCKAPAFSGAVHMAAAHSTLNVTGSTSISRCYANKGGAIYLKRNVIMNLSGSASFTKNGYTTSGQQVTDGACIYLSEDSRLNISGKLTFSENYPQSDKYVVNGGVNSLARQDIYIAGYADEEATSLHIAGDLTGDTIWVWMQNLRHQQPVPGNNQFATTETSVSDASLEKLRNAHDNAQTLCLHSDYLTGVRLPGTDSTGTLVYWNRVYEVTFMKKDNKNYPVAGAEFVLYTDSTFTTEVARAKSADGENDKDAKGIVLEEGTVDFAAIPIGIYYMKEAPHKSYKPNNTIYLLLVGTPTLVSDEYNALWTSGPLNVPDAKTTVSENTPKFYGLYELDANGEAILDTNLTLTGKSIVNERLDYPVSFMKLDGEGVALPGSSFTIYVAENPDEDGKPDLNENSFPRLKLWERGDESEIIATSADGSNKYKDMNNKTLKKGVVYYREIPMGTYYLRETAYSSRNGNNRISFYVESDRVFRLEVKGEDNISMYEWDRSNTSAYEDTELSKSGGYYQVRNINAVCKLTNGSTLLYERSLDGETLHPAVYASLEEGFDSAQNRNFFDANGNEVTVLNNLKLQVLKDCTITEPITYSNVNRPLTFTTASRTASSVDRYIFNTNRTSDASSALISRAYSETNVKDGALITLGGGASLTLQNIKLNGQELIHNGRAIHVTAKNETGDGSSLIIGNNVKIQSFKVEFGESDIKGGAILLDDGTSLTIDGGYNRTAVFSDNTVKNTSSNDVGADGGAIAVGKECTFSITNAQFTNNSATATASGKGNGGAVSISKTREASHQAQLPINNVVFTGNTATYNGGAIRTAENCHLTVDNCTFKNNKANTGDGGAIAVLSKEDAQSVLTITGGTTFTSNSADGGNGGAVKIGGYGTLTVNKATLSQKNTAVKGGAIYAAPYAEVTFTKGAVSGNKASQGSAFYVDDHAQFTVTGGTVKGNTVSKTCGAVEIGGNSARLNFSGAAFIYDNKYGSQQRNVVLSVNSDEVINVTDRLGADAKIGVYATDDAGGRHKAGVDFATYKDGVTGEFATFKNDREPILYGMDDPDEDNKVCWAYSTITVKKEWKLLEGYESQRPTDVTAEVRKGTDAVETLTLSDTDGWEATTSTRLEPGQTYSVVETHVGGTALESSVYAATYSVNSVDEIEPGNTVVTVTNTNTLLPMQVKKIWDSAIPSTQRESITKIGFKVYGVVDNSQTELPCFVGNWPESGEVSELTGDSGAQIWETLVYVPKYDANGAEFSSYDIKEVDVSGDAWIYASHYDSNETSSNVANWKEDTDTENFQDTYVKFHATKDTEANDTVRNRYKNVHKIDFYYVANGKLYYSSTDFGAGVNLNQASLRSERGSEDVYIKIRLPRNVDPDKIALLANPDKTGLYLHTDASTSNFAYGILTYNVAGNKNKPTGAPNFAQNKENNGVKFDWVAFGVTPPSAGLCVEGTPSLSVYTPMTLTLTNFEPIARVTNDNGVTWSYYPALTDITEKGVTLSGAFNYANTLSGDVQIELLKQGDTDANGRYTLTNGFTFNHGANITIRTTQEAPWNSGQDGERFVSKVSRGFTGDGGLVTVDGGTALTIENVILDGGSIGSMSCSGNGGLINVKSGTVSIQAGATLRNSTAVNGGAVNVGSGGTMTVGTGATITNNTATNGGAVYAANGATVDMGGGTISGNTATTAGAGVYLAEGSALKISGNPSFGGSGVTSAETGALDNASGNLLKTALSAQSDNGESYSAKNGGADYTYARQDIYIAGYANTTPATSLVVTGNITSGTGTIWVWAEREPHDNENEQFAVMKKADGTDPTTAWTGIDAFRNARTDFDSTASHTRSDFLRGVTGGEVTYIYWGTVGQNVYFQKVNGLGVGLNDATFTLFTDAACTKPLKKGTADVTATSQETSVTVGQMTKTVQGLVTFEKIPNDVYFMKETAFPKDSSNNDLYTNGNTYVLVVGSSNLVSTADAVLSGLADDVKNAEGAVISKGDFTKQTEQYSAAYGVDDYAIFLLEKHVTPTNGWKAVTAPDIATFGVMNVSTKEHKVILRKVSESQTALQGAQFRIFRADMTEVTDGQPTYQAGDTIPQGKAVGDSKGYYESASSGVYFIGVLPEGKYYVVETSAPKAEGTDPTAYSGNVNKVFEVLVEGDGITEKIIGDDENEWYKTTSTESEADRKFLYDLLSQNS